MKIYDPRKKNFHKINCLKISESEILETSKTLRFTLLTFSGLAIYLNGRGRVYRTMIINDKEAAARLNSPMNLINRLRRDNGNKNNAMSLFGIGLRPQEKKDEIIKSSFNPFQQAKPEEKPAEVPSAEPEPNIDTILKSNESQIKLSLAHDQALDLLNKSVAALSAKLDDVSAAKLPSVISAASKTVESIRRERAEASKNQKDHEIHYHFYTPQQKKVEDYEIIDVTA